MLVKLRDVMNLPELKKINLIAGASGMDRVMQWAHVFEYPGFVQWLQGGELIFTTGIGLQGNLEILPQLVRACNNRDAAGLVISLGGYIEKTPPEVVELADELGFPIFEVPWEVPLIKVISAIYNFIDVKRFEIKSIQDILENVLYGCTADDQEQIIARAAACGYDLDKYHQIMVVKFEQPDDSLKEPWAITPHQIMNFEMQLQSLIVQVLQQLGKKVLMLVRLDTAIIMLPTLNTDKDQKRTREIAVELLRVLTGYFDKYNFCIGWGNPYAEIYEVRKSLWQAEKAARIAQISGTGKIKGYDELGFYKVLFSVKDRSELEAFRNEILEPLQEYDQKHGAELVNTLVVFWEENGNSARVSERLFIHRNTLQYRLQKISDITGKNIVDPDERIHLYLVMLVHKYLAIM